MNRMTEANREFMLPGGYPIKDKPITKKDFEENILINGKPTTFKDYLLARRDWIIEECFELSVATGMEDIAGIIDALVDLLYFIHGTAVSIGIDLDPFFEIVHKANMDKFFDCPDCSGMGKKSDLLICSRCLGSGITAMYKDDGKLTKPAGWTPPDLTKELERQRNPNGKEKEKD